VRVRARRRRAQASRRVGRRPSPSSSESRISDTCHVLKEEASGEKRRELDFGCEHVVLILPGLLNADSAVWHALDVGIDRKRPKAVQNALRREQNRSPLSRGPSLTLTVSSAESGEEVPAREAQRRGSSTSEKLRDKDFRTPPSDIRSRLHGATLSGF
jgi:hypothetical protein